MKKHLKQILAYSFIVISVIIFYLIFNCPIKFFTGMCCPGCGMTRAALSVLRGEFSLALHYHPAILIMPLAGIVFFTRKRIPKKILNILIVAFAIVMGAIYIYRLLNPNEIVFIDLKEGYIYKALHFILEKFNN